jgi:hypothetical protein
MELLQKSDFNKWFTYTPWAFKNLDLLETEITDFGKAPKALARFTRFEDPEVDKALDSYFRIFAKAALKKVLANSKSLGWIVVEAEKVVYLCRWWAESTKAALIGVTLSEKLEQLLGVGSTYGPSITL